MGLTTRQNICSGTILIKLFALNHVPLYEDRMRLDATSELGGSTATSDIWPRYEKEQVGSAASFRVS
jgi:hypothetical protein